MWVEFPQAHHAQGPESLTNSPTHHFPTRLQYRNLSHFTANAKTLLNKMPSQTGSTLNFVGYGPTYGKQQGLLSSPTIILILANVFVFIIMLVSGDFGDCSSLTCELLAQSNDLVLRGFYWQLFTSMFVHFGFLHIIFNMFALYYFGRLNETAFSAPKFLTIYLVSGLLGSVMTLVLLPAETLSGGASGAIFGLVGSYVAVARQSQSMGFALLYAILLFFQSSFLPGVNIFAHLFGLVAGLVLGFVLSARRAPSGYSYSYSYPT
jgi:rhomboid protease GluP